MAKATKLGALGILRRDFRRLSTGAWLAIGVLLALLAATVAGPDRPPRA